MGRNAGDYSDLVNRFDDGHREAVQFRAPVDGPLHPPNSSHRPDRTDRPDRTNRTYRTYRTNRTYNHPHPFP